MLTVKLLFSQSSGYLITRVAARTTDITARVIVWRGDRFHFLIYVFTKNLKCEKYLVTSGWVKDVNVEIFLLDYNLLS